MRSHVLTKLFTIAIAGVLWSALAMPTAGGASGDGLDALVSGPFTGTTSYTFTVSGCSFVHQVHDATYGTRSRPSGSFHLDGCVGLGTTFPYTGTFTLRAKGHATLTGTVSGTVRAEIVPCAPLEFVLTVTGGTGRLARASGSIALHGAWCGRGDIPAVEDPISGALVGSLARS